LKCIRKRVAEAATDSASTVSFTPPATTLASSVFAVHLDASGLHQVVPGSGSERAEFADDGKHFSSAVSNALHPSIWSMCSIEGTCRQFWQPRSLATYGLTTPTRLDFKAEDGTPLHGCLMLPANATGKIPLLVYVYGGPAGQTPPTLGWFHQPFINIWYSTVSLYSPSTIGHPQPRQKVHGRHQGPIRRRRTSRPARLP